MASTALRWTMQYRLPQMVLRRAARRGQLGARLAIDASLWDDPFPTYEQMRTQGPIVSSGMISSTSSHAVASEVLRSPLFRVGIGAPERLSPVTRWLLTMVEDPWAVGPAEPPSMLAVDPPAHTRYRRLVSKVFTPRALGALEGRVEEIADQLLDGMAQHRTTDLVTTYAGPLPVRVISEILGIPLAMQSRMLAWGNAAAMTLEPGLSYGQFRQATTALHEVHHWLADHTAALRSDPGDDLLSKLAVLVDGGETLDDVELRATALLVVGAGFETTVNLIANGVVQMLDHPDQLAALRDDPSLWGNAVDEILRYDSPVQVTVRVAAQDTELAGHPIPAGRFVSIMLGGANRDPEVFTQPQRFDIRRVNARDHLAFSAGIHYCLGASLARMEGAIALRMLFERFPELAISGPPVRRRMRVLRGYDSLPVRLARARVPA